MERTSLEELEAKYDATTTICEDCGKNEATDTVEEPYGYSHYDGYVYTHDKHICKECLEEK